MQPQKVNVGHVASFAMLEQENLFCESIAIIASYVDDLLLAT